MPLEPPTGQAPDAAKVYAAFVRDGRVTHLPSKASRRATLLDLVAGLFEPGVRYPEPAVNEVLLGVFHDHAALRRELVDLGLLDREDGVYWRSGGTVAI